MCETFTQRRIIAAISGAGSSATPLFFKRIILLAEQLLYALTKRHREGMAPHDVKQLVNPRQDRRDRRVRLLVGRFGRSANWDTYRQVADVEATVSRCREMALEKRLAVDLLLQKLLRVSSIGPVLLKEMTTILERNAQGN